MVCSEKLRRWRSSSIIFRRWVTGTPPVTHTYIQAIRQQTLHYLTRSVRRAAATCKRVIVQVDLAVGKGWHQIKGSMPSRSFTACRNRCLHPRYFSVVCTDTWPRRNWICSNSPPESWQNRAHDLLRSCGASLETPSLPAYSFTTCQTTFSVIFVPQTTPVRQTQRKILPCVISATASQSSIVRFTHSGIGTVRMWPPFPTRSTMAQWSSRR